MWISLRVFHQIVGFFRKSSHISRIVLRGNVTREFEHNYDDDEEGNETILRFIKQSKNSERAAQFLADSFAIIALFPFRDSGFRNPGNFAWNPKSWVLKSGIQLKESGLPQMMGIRNLSFNDKSQESWTWNSESTTWNPESESVLILGFPYMGRTMIVVILKLNG